MNDQNNIDLINEALYKLDVPNEPIKRIMFYFTVLHDSIDYEFPPNYLNYNNPYFKTYSEMQKFFALAVALKPENLHTSNVLIFYNKKNFYKPDQNDCRYEFKIIDPNESSDSKFSKNYQNSFNIKNINSQEKQFEIKINENIEYSQSEDSDTPPEDYYYNEGLEDGYLPEDKATNKTPNLNGNKYNEFRTKYNEQIVKKSAKADTKSDNSNCHMEEENLNENINETITVKINIINKIVASKDWIDYIYNEPMKKNLSNIKIELKEEDEIRVKSISLPKNIFFYLIIGALIVLLVCASVMINTASSLNNDKRFIDYEGKNKISVDSDIIPYKKCYRHIRDGNILSMISGSFAIFFIVFLFCLYVTISCTTKMENKKRKSDKKKKK